MRINIHEKCEKCKKEINTTEDIFVVVPEKILYHLECYKEKFWEIK